MNNCAGERISSIAYQRSLKLNWNSEFVIFAPLCPLNTYIHSRATATGKLQQVGGQSPFCITSSQLWVSSCQITHTHTLVKHTRGIYNHTPLTVNDIVHISFNLALPSYPANIHNFPSNTAAPWADLATGILPAKRHSTHWPE